MHWPLPHAQFTEKNIEQEYSNDKVNKKQYIYIEK